MPGLPFTQLPAKAAQGQQTNPRDYISGPLKQKEDFIKRDYDIQWKMLRKTTTNEKEFRQNVDQLIAKTDAQLNQLRFKFEQKNAALSQIQGMVDQGLLSPEAGQQATWRMVLPQETEKAMFPSEGARPAPFSPSQLKSYRESISEFAEGAKQEPGLEWGPPKRKQKSLVKQYRGWQDYIGYEDLPLRRRQQADIEWDDLMASEDYLEWNPESPDIKALRPTGKMQQAAAKRITPFGKSVRDAKPNGPKPVPTRRELLARYKTLGGSNTAEGRSFADKHLR